MIDPFIDGLAYLGEVREPFEFSNRRIRRIFAKASYESGGRFGLSSVVLAA